ncbi:hypothetical protein NHQ30_011399 [Ciborinia camelliae]|nr:hypothetical protein NHQ30_011399 [Ciborinia camelliae]
MRLQKRLENRRQTPATHFKRAHRLWCRRCNEGGRFTLDGTIFKAEYRTKYPKDIHGPTRQNCELAAQISASQRPRIPISSTLMIFVLDFWIALKIPEELGISPYK